MFRIIFLSVLCFFSGFTFADVSNEEANAFSLAALKGNWVFINYWATWCHPCVEEIPVLNRFYAQQQHKNVRVYAVNYEGLTLAEQQKFIKKYHIEYPSVSADPVANMNPDGITVVPTTLVFNPKGELVKTLYGQQTMRTLIRAMR